MPPEYAKHANWFEEHIHPHESMLKSWLEKRFPSVCDTDDIIQEAYIRLLRARDRKQLESPRSYLFVTARNLAIDSIRKTNRSSENPLAENDAESVIDDAEDPQATLETQQEHQVLNEAIETLPQRCREIFTLRKIENMSQSQIAEKLGISVNTVTAQLSIGVRKCADYVERRLDRTRAAR